jgi:23S rRNA pseudouridine2605 synthase
LRLYSERLGPRRLDRALGDLAVCSRLQAPRWIRAGRVAVDGAVETFAGRQFDPRRQRLSVDGVEASLDPERHVHAFHKPTGVLTTRQDPGGRATVYDHLDPRLPWLFPVGRLDRDSSGLLILTNDHRLAHRLTDPGHHVSRVYHVRVEGHPESAALECLRQGLTLTGPGGHVETRPAQVRALGVTRRGESWLEITLREGRYRQVRRMCVAIGHPVRQLVRVQIGSFALADLPEGDLRRLDEAAARRLAGD